jgi:hypothetical protein
VSVFLKRNRKGCSKKKKKKIVIAFKKRNIKGKLFSISKSCYNFGCFFFMKKYKLLRKQGEGTFSEVLKA